VSRLTGKTALITGAARGIGKAIAQAYIREGARVAIADVLANEVSLTADEIGALGVKIDVADMGSIEACISQVEDAFGGIDILVNNAGVFNMSPINEITYEDYRRQFDINVGGTIFMSQAVVSGMKQRGRGGAIINFSSQAGRRGEPNISIYCATKAAVISVTQSLALELAKDGIRVNAVAPGVVDTPMWDVVDGLFAHYESRPKGEKKRVVGEAVPLGHMGTPEEIADPCVFLASDEARYVTAQCLNVDGGNWMN